MDYLVWPPGSGQTAAMEQAPLTVRPIGVIRSLHSDRMSAPRQPRAALGQPGTIELWPGHGFEDAVRDLERFSHVWVLFWFNRSDHWRPTVQPPRSGLRRGVFSTRAPYRPNPIGMSVLRLQSIDGLRLAVLDVDLLDGTPILDLKPYVRYADSVPDANDGWIADDSQGGTAPPDPHPDFDVIIEDAARQQLDYLRAEHAIDVETQLVSALRLGPRPHAYRRIRAIPGGFQIGVKEWRARFRVDGRRMIVEAIESGIRERDLLGDAPGLEAHRTFVRTFPPR